MNKNKFKDYIVNKKWSSRRLGVGYIIQCNEGDDYGLIYGYEDHNRKQYNCLTWIYYFNKPLNLCYNQYHPVTYLKSYDIIDPLKELYEVEHVTPLNEYKLIDFENEAPKPRKQIGIEGGYIYLDIWEQMCHGNLFIDYSDISSSIYFPVINENDKTITYYDYHAYNSADKPSCILTCFVGLNKYREYSKCIKYGNLFSNIEKIKEYIDTFNIDENLNLFISGEKGHFHSYPGRDDSFFYTKYWKSTSKDAYLNQLVNFHEEEDYYNCCGRSEEDYDRIDQEETTKLRNAVRSAYNKDNHFLFLLKNYFSELEFKKEQYNLYAKEMNNYIREKDKTIFEATYDKNSFRKFVDSFNRNY